MWVYCILSYLQNEQMKDTSQQIINEEVQVLHLAHELLQTIETNTMAARSYILDDGVAFKELFETYHEKTLASYEKLKQYDDVKNIEDAIKSALAWNTTVKEEVFPLYENGDAEGALAKLNGLSQTAIEIHKQYTVFTNNKNEEIQQQGIDLAEGMHSTKIVLTFLFCLMMAVTTFMIFYLPNTISKPLNRLLHRIESITNGELNHEPLEVISKDETARLTIAINTMAQQMRDVVSKIQDEAFSITESSNHLELSANEVMKELTQTTQAVEHIADGTEVQASSASDLRTIMNNFTQNIKSANENSLKVQSHSESVQVMTEEGQKFINDTEEQIYKIDAIVKQAVNRVEGLNNQTREITQLVQVITEIADQTNLLALNAAIEAARAGEQGKGFAVVADEVRKLAEQVSHSVSNISTIVDAIQNETNVVTSSLLDGYKEVEKGTEQTKISSETYRNISVAITEMVANIKIVSQNLQHIANHTGDIDNEIESVASVSEQSAASLEQTAATIQEVSTSMEDVTQNAKRLHDTADELQKVVRQFKL